MKNSRVLYILLLLVGNFCATLGTSSQLDGFLKRVADAHEELEGLDEPFVDRRHRGKRSIGEMLARFEDESELDDGDAWYQAFRAAECQHGGGCLKTPLRWVFKNDDDEYVEEEEKEISNGKEAANDLSHEADYKLSKAEQEAEEKNLPDSVWRRHHNSKRHVDPIEAVKLKTRMGVLKNSDRPFVASPILPQGGDKIFDATSSRRRRDSADHWKRRVAARGGRKLLSVEELEFDVFSQELTKNNLFDSMRTDAYHREKGDKILDAMSTQNPKESADLSKRRVNVKGGRKLLSFEELESDVPSQDLPQNTFSARRNDLMRTDAFMELQNYLEKAQGRKNVSSSAKVVPLNLVDKDRDVNIKLHMPVNATVLGDDKLPENYHSNNTITFKPPPLVRQKEGDEPGKEQVRNRRRVVFPIMSDDQNMRKSVISATKDFPLEDIISGRLTSQLVAAVFEVVKMSPSLKVLWPGLMRNRLPSPSDSSNFDVIRTEDNEFDLHRTETMLRQAMEALSTIIDQQLRSRSCVPLPPNLKAFYNLILQNQAEWDRPQERRKREVATISDTQVRQKSKIVKKLLRDYEELPRDDQEQVASIKRRLLLAAQQLREMQQESNPRKRQILDVIAADNFSPEYTKLARTAELLLHTSLQDSNTPLGFTYI